MIVVVRRLGSPIGLRPRRFGGIELDVERVFINILRHAIEQGHAVVPRVGADVAGQFSDIAGERREEKLRAVFVVVVEKLVGAHADGK